METHPLTKLVVGLVGLGIIVGAVWVYRSVSEQLVDTGPTAEAAGQPTSGATPPDGASGRPPISPNPPWPKVVLEETEHDFGVMEVSGKDSYDFTIFNRGEAPLVLGKGPSSCKCTISELASNQVPPQESATINLAWNPKSPAEEFRQTATIWTNDPEMQDVVLTIVGRVTQTVTVRPQDVWRMSDLSSNEEKVLVGYIFSEVLDSFELAPPEATSDSLAVQVEPMTAERLGQEDAKSGYRVEVTVKPNQTVGTFREKVSFSFISPDISPIDILVEGKRTGPITFLRSGRTFWSEQRMIVGLGEFDADEGTSGTLLLSVRGMEDAELELLSVEADPDHLQVRLEPPDRKIKARGRKMYKLVFAVPPRTIGETRNGSKKASVVLKTNHPEAAKLKVNVSYVSR